MATDNQQFQDVDLDKTDRLPILEGTLFDADVEDDAVVMEHGAVLAASSVVSGRSAASIDFQRPVGVDLPSLAESVRSVEERIARQSAEFEILTRSYEKAREAESAAQKRASALTADLAAMKLALDAEQLRTREFDRALAEKNAAAEATRARIEESLRDAERFQSESKTLRESLAARDATIGQVLHSLGERDAQLSALQRDHAQITPVLEERTKVGVRLEAELKATLARAASTAAELQVAQASVASVAAELKFRDRDLLATREELALVKGHSTTYLERLRSREWRRGFDENIFRESDAKAGEQRAAQGVLQVERDALRGEIVDLSGKLAAQEEAIRELREAAAADANLRAGHAEELAERERSRQTLVAQIASLEADVEAATRSLRERQEEIDSVRSHSASELLRTQELLSTAEKAHAALSAKMLDLQTNAEQREQEMAVLMAHLQEARRPIVSFEADVKRLTDELSLKTQSMEHLAEENRSLRATLERTRGALEEREFLIRRLERSESNNANVLGRIQTSIERLGAAAVVPSASIPAVASAAPVECVAEMLRLDGQSSTSHVLVKRTRIGRAPGCELQIESSSVSRHHALVLLGARDVIIEDLNSTNGVIVNGRKVTRQLVNDGDVITIGDAQFRLSVKLVPRILEAAPSGP